MEIVSDPTAILEKATSKQICSSIKQRKTEKSNADNSCNNYSYFTRETLFYYIN